MRESKTDVKVREFSVALLALSWGGFGIGLTEFVVAGLLTEISTSLQISISQAGNLISLYALAVVPGALIITPFLMNRDPKYALMTLLVFFTSGNILSAWSPNFSTMVLGRLVSALAHGGYFGIGAVLAGKIVSEGRKSSAIALLFSGLTVANVLGVPLGAFVGQHLGWRAVFWAISVVGVTALIGIFLAVPLVGAEDEQLPIAQQYRTLMKIDVAISLSITALVFGGMFGVFAYIEPMLRQLAGFSVSSIPWLLMLFGLGLFAGNIIGGRAADKNPDRTILILSILLPTVIVFLGILVEVKLLAVFLFVLMGVLGFATVPGLQARVMRHARGATTLASAANVAAFNLGNTIGVAMAGFSISWGYGLTSPTVTGAVLIFLGLLLLLISLKRGKSQKF